MNNFDLICVSLAGVDTAYRASDFCIIWLVKYPGFKHAKAQMHQLAHRGTEGVHLGFATGECAENGVLH